MPSERRCPGCDQTKPLTTKFFARDRTDHTGFAHYCKPCKYAMTDDWISRNPEEHSSYHAAYRLKHAAKKRRQTAAWRQKYPERAAANVRRWFAEHPGLLPSQRTWRLLHAEDVRLMSIRAKHRRRALEADAPGHCTQAQLDARIAYYGGCCWLCGCPWEAIDHVKPITKGGTNWPANLRPICNRCNSKKGKKWPYPNPNEAH
jgi:5-methylcytosine-specific restriction endonuclease McrA